MDLETLLYFIGVVVYFIYTAYSSTQKGQKKPPATMPDGEPIPQGTKTQSIEDILGEYLDGPAPKAASPPPSPQKEAQPTFEYDQMDDFEEEDYHYEEAEVAPPKVAPKAYTDRAPQPTKLAISKENRDSSETDVDYKPMEYDLFGGKNKGPSLKEKLAKIEAQKQIKRDAWLAKNKKVGFKFSAKDAVLYNIIWERKYK